MAVWLLGLTVSGSVLAFDADVHPAFTRAAVEVYQACPGVTVSAEAAEAAEALIAGTQAEDASLATVGQRISNWHFYNRNASLKPMWFASRNLDHIFATRVRQLNERVAQGPAASTAQVYQQAGRVLHYIQDMSVPAHVVPVFHVKLLVWNLEDGFDQFPLSPSMASFRLSQAQCEALRADAEGSNPSGRLTRTASATLAAIGQRGGSVNAGAWREYWVYPSPEAAQAEKGWGEYGRCTFVKGTQAPGCKSDAELEALFAQQSVQTLKDSVWMLFYVDRQLKARAGETVVINP
ncbi:MULTISPECIES: hypothetical protein [unclassified Pseudomonas]|uniref:hypothetical protein n=1 Tax=unclassified Pseudomonas TaxID=196821 RepID=UPI000B8844E3|nr:MULTISPECIES: hypothetical protein [unclassified Pseudomonas]